MTKIKNRTWPPTWADVHNARVYLVDVLPAAVAAMSASECVQIGLLLEGLTVDVAVAQCALETRLRELRAQWSAGKVKP